MHEERGAGEQPPEGQSAWSASPDGADDHVWPAAGADSAWGPGADASTQPGAEDTGPLPPRAEDPMASRLEGADPLVPGADEPGPLTPGAEGSDQVSDVSDGGTPDTAQPVSPDAEGTRPLVPGLDAPAPPGSGYEHPPVAYPGAPPPPPPPGPYGPPGGGYPGSYPGAGYPGAPGYPGASYPGGGHVSGGYPGSGYQGSAYQGSAYQGGDAYQGGGGYQGGGYQGAGYPGGGYPGGGYPGGGYGTGSYGAYPGDPGYGSYGDGRPPKRPNRVITYVLVAALAAGVGAGTVLAMRHSSNNPASYSLPGAGSIPQPGSGSTGGGANSSTTQSVVKKVSPGIVDVISTPSYQPGGTLEGTGMILNSSGLVLTNNHVIEGTSREVAKIANNPTQQYNVTVLGTDDTDDVALLQLDGAKGLKPVPFGNSNDVQMGQSVVALGNADGQDGAPAVVTGSITDLNRSIQASDAGADTTENLHDMLQTNAPIVEGDSGGALASTQGLVIGMDTAANTQNGTGQSMGFAIPINRALSIARQIAAGQASKQIQFGYPAFLGVTVARAGSNPSSSTSLQTQLRELQEAADQQGASGLGGLGGSGRNGGCLSTSQATAPQRAPDVSSGVLIGGVLCDTPVASAGLTMGSVITGIDSQAISSPAQLTSVLDGYKPGQSITLSWVTANGQHKTSKMTLISGPAK
jgi:S1-C subfamily serine protease